MSCKTGQPLRLHMGDPGHTDKRYQLTGLSKCSSTPKKKFEIKYGTMFTGTLFVINLSFANNTWIRDNAKEVVLNGEFLDC
ncbi:hypothetical protein FKM82_006747 [Ascaphus truei]